MNAVIYQPTMWQGDWRGSYLRYPCANSIRSGSLVGWYVFQHLLNFLLCDMWDSELHHVNAVCEVLPRFESFQLVWVTLTN